MPSQQKLIKQGIKYTDSLFDEIAKRLANGIRTTDTLEDFLSKYNEYTNGTGENNPLVVNGYKDKMLSLILQETNNHKFSRPSQKELTRVTIENRVGDLIVDVGEDIQQSVRDIVLEGYNQNLSQDEIAENITNRIGSIKTKRARAIARTEVARTATISDYVINKERGATHFYVECRNTACPVCKEAWHDGWTPERDEYFVPSDSSANGKGWIGDRVYSMSDTGMLPPIHPNCRCVAYFISESDIGEGVTVKKPEPKETKVTENPRIAELEKEIEEVQALADKYRNKGNNTMVNMFDEHVKRLTDELNNFKNNVTITNPTETDTTQADIINNALADALKDVGLEDIAPERKSIKPDVKIEKDIQTTHESNLWENLAKKHGFELVEASNTKVTFYDKEHETPIRCKIPLNDKWIDYTNSGRKKINIEDILTAYNSATEIQKRATPIINLKGKSLDQGEVLIGKSTFELNLYEGAFYKMEGSINGGNLKGAMHHEMWHCVDIRMTPEDEARVQQLLNSNKKGSAYKKDVTKDRRSKKKTGGRNFCSSYARQSGSGNKVYEDFAEAGSVMSSNTFLIQDAIGGYVEITKKEFMKQYPNRAKHFEDLMKNGKLLW